MKLKTMKFYSILILQFIFLSVYSQDTITWAGVYNFDIGDIFHYDESTSDAHQTKSECLILEKSFNADSTEILYVRDVIRAYRNDTWPPFVPNEITSYTDTVSYSINNNTVTASDSVWSSHEWYNNRWVHSNTSEGFFIFEKSYVKNLGQVRHRSTSYTDFGTNVLEWNLVYYHKAVSGEEWGTDLNLLSSAYQKVVEFKVYPNPTNGIINWHSERNSTAPISFIRVYDSLGKRILKKPVSHDQSSIDLSELKEGTYILELHTENGISRESIVIR